MKKTMAPIKEFIGTLRRLIQQRVPYFSLKTILLFFGVNLFFLFYFDHIFVRLALFFGCTLILIKYGKLPLIDIDPVPISAAILYFLYGFSIAFQFIIWTIPVSDALSSRLNHYSLINFISLSIGIAAISLIPVAGFVALSVMLLLIFNTIRSLIVFTTGAPPFFILINLNHALIYSLIIAAAWPIISAFV